MRNLIKIFLNFIFSELKFSFLILVVCRPKLTLNFGESGLRNKHPTLGLPLGLSLNPSTGEPSTSADAIDINLPLEKQG